MYSINSGTVFETRNEDESAGYGNYIIIQTDNYYFMYAHLESEPNFTVGDNISFGQVIGLSGDSETKDEPHLQNESREKSGGFYSSSPVNNNVIKNENCN